MPAIYTIGNIDKGFTRPFLTYTMWTNKTHRRDKLISEAMKYKALKSLSEGPKTSTELYNMFKSRGPEYRAEMADWLEGKMAVKYRIPLRGRVATVYSLEPSGAAELDRLSALVEVV